MSTSKQVHWPISRKKVPKLYGTRRNPSSSGDFSISKNHRAFLRPIAIPLMLYFLERLEKSNLRAPVLVYSQSNGPGAVSGHIATPLRALLCVPPPSTSTLPPTLPVPVLTHWCQYQATYSFPLTLMFGNQCLPTLYKVTGVSIRRVGAQAPRETKPDFQTNAMSAMVSVSRVTTAVPDWLEAS